MSGIKNCSLFIDFSDTAVFAQKGNCHIWEESSTWLNFLQPNETSLSRLHLWQQNFENVFDEHHWLATRGACALAAGVANADSN